MMKNYGSSTVYILSILFCFYAELTYTAAIRRTIRESQKTGQFLKTKGINKVSANFTKASKMAGLGAAAGIIGTEVIETNLKNEYPDATMKDLAISAGKETWNFITNKLINSSENDVAKESDEYDFIPKNPFYRPSGYSYNPQNPNYQQIQEAKLAAKDQYQQLKEFQKANQLAIAFNAAQKKPGQHEPVATPDEIAGMLLQTHQETAQGKKQPVQTRMVPKNAAHILEAKSFYSSLSTASTWVREPYKSYNFSSKQGLWNAIENAAKTPFRLISNYPVESAVLAIAGIAYYRYYMNKYKKAGQGVATDLEKGIDEADKRHISFGRQRLAADVKHNENLMEDLKTLEADLYRKLALPSR